MKTTIDTTITMGSGDVFTDLGFSPAESRNLRIRSEMMTALRKFIEKGRLDPGRRGQAIEGESAQGLGSDARQDQPVLAGHAR